MAEPLPGSPGMEGTRSRHLLGGTMWSMAGTGPAVAWGALGGITVVAGLALVTLGTFCVVLAAL